MNADHMKTSNTSRQLSICGIEIKEGNIVSIKESSILSQDCIEIETVSLLNLVSISMFSPKG